MNNRVENVRRTVIRGATGVLSATLWFGCLSGCEAGGPSTDDGVGGDVAGAPVESHLAFTHTTLSNGGTYRVHWSLEPDPIPLNEEFTILLDIRHGDDRLVDADSITLTVDARMPEHRHGMIQRPVITRDERGCFVVEGMLFHMPGFWQLHFDVTQGGVTERAQDDVTLD